MELRIFENKCSEKNMVYFKQVGFDCVEHEGMYVYSLWYFTT
jgi:hypothetical protein